MTKMTGRGKVRELVCEECHRTYTTKGPVTRFCSNRCSTIFTGRQKTVARGEVICARCGRTFTGQIVDWDKKPRRRYCSTHCYVEHQHARKVLFECEHCGSVVPRRAGRTGNVPRARFCSKECAIAGQIKSGPTIHKRTGYAMVRDGDRRREEHRVVMERVLGRALFPYETIHHRNGVRTDNRPENLELWVGRHGPGGRLEEVLAWYAKVLTDHGYHVTPPS